MSLSFVFTPIITNSYTNEVASSLLSLSLKSNLKFFFKKTKQKEKNGKELMILIFEIVSSAFMGSIALYAKYKQAGIGNDGDKLNKIFTLTGLNVKDGQKTYTTELLKKVNHSWGTEYRYRIPLGYILIQLFPLFVKILEQVGKSL